MQNAVSDGGGRLPWHSTVYMTTALAALLVLLAPAACAESAGRDVTHERDLVGICYSTWFNPVVGEGKPVYNISEILAANPAEPKWGPMHAFHFWGRPVLGYYRSDDRAVIRCHMTMLGEAGIDFVVLDNTNMNPAWPPAYKEEMVYKPFAVLLETLREMRTAGAPVPHVVIWCPTSVAGDMHERFTARPEHAGQFVQWNDGNGTMPLLLTTDGPDPALRDRFAVRKMWGLQPRLAEREWSFLQKHPQPVAMSNGTPEQITVAAALQQTCMTEPTAIGRRGGRTLAGQWRRAFEVRPKFVVVTWWNEWIAQRFEHEGRVAFVDNYNREFSRDIEPMDGGHGDAYYRFLKAYVAAYKSRAPFPEGLVEPEASSRAD